MNPTRPATPVHEVEVEVLPKGQVLRPGPGANDPVAAVIARIMDSLFTIPGTGVKVGLDPILGLLPVIGSPASALVSMIMLVRSAQAGVPVPVLGRMALNVILNAILDEIPVIGDFLSVFFRSNKINYELMEKHAGTRGAYTTRDKLLVGGIVLGALLFLLCALIGFAYLTLTGIHWLFGGNSQR